MLVGVANPVAEGVVEANLAAAVGRASPAAVVAAVARVGVEAVAEVAEPVPAEVVLAQHPDRADVERAPQVWAGSLFYPPLAKR